MAAKKKTTRKKTKRKPRARPKPQPLTAKKRELFLQALAEAGNVTAAAKVASIARQRVYDIRKQDPKFAAAWADAEQQAADSLEAEAWRRGLEGVEEPLHYQGTLTGDTVRKYSDTLLIFLLKGARPEKYRELRGVDVTSGGKPLAEGAVQFYLPANGREGKKQD